MNMFKAIAAMLRMIRFSHTLFALPFGVMAALLGGNGGQPGFCGWQKLVLIIWCMVTARSVAMTFNRIVDAPIDARNPRTANRELPRKVVSQNAAMRFLGVCAALFVAGATLFWKPLGPWFGFGNYWPAIMAVPVLVFICLYSFTKRFTWASHFWLGISLMMTPMGAWVAVSPPEGRAVSMVPMILGGAVLMWSAGFDIIYACQDIAVDRRDGLHSIPARFGIDRALWISRTCHVVAVVLLGLLAAQAELGRVYQVAVAIVAVLLICEHVLVRRGAMQHIKIAFGTINGIISILLAGATVADLFNRNVL